MKKEILLWHLLFFTGLVQAQQETPARKHTRKFYAFTPLQLMVPVGEFKDKANFGTGLGLGFRGAWEVLKDRYIFLGGEIDYLMYHKSSVKLPYNGTTARTAVNNQIFMTHAMVHVIPRLNTKLYPYAEGLLGFKHLYSKVNIVDTQADSDNNQIDNYALQKDWAMSFGGAVGIAKKTKSGLAVDLRVMFLNGSRTRYVQGRSVAIKGPYDITYSTRLGFTPSLFIQLNILGFD
ncbi:MAG: hypothetical protein H7Y04_11340 [Verrucomicrobia bacterium]|nr:hypothetical protein [Cytophagales bacterium]